MAAAADPNPTAASLASPPSTYLVFDIGNMYLFQLQHLENRRKTHKEAVSFRQDILRRRPVEWEACLRKDLTGPIRDVDLVITLGGDGTLLHASHYVDDSLPVVGVNSDPTQPEEVEKYRNEFDASRSIGHLCAATVDNFEQIIDNVLEERMSPSDLSRISIGVNSQVFPTYALNDILLAHPCPATLSRCSFKIRSNGQSCTPLVNSRSSGLRVSTAAGSTASLLSAGGSLMPILSPDLQYMVREPIPSGEDSSLLHGFIKPHQSMDATWFCREGVIYIDCCHVRCFVKNGDCIEISSKAPVLKIFLPHLVHQISS